LATRTCPHCAVANPDSPIVTLCRACARPLRTEASAAASAPVEKVARSEPGAPTEADRSCPRCKAAISVPPGALAATCGSCRAYLRVTPGGSVATACAPGPGRPAPLAIPLPLHLRLYHGGGNACALIVGVAYVYLVFSGRLALGAWFPPVGLLVLALAFHVPRQLLRRLVAARCPRCSGAATLRQGSEIRYECRACGHTHYTGLELRRPREARDDHPRRPPGCP